jgi:uncharacterized protein
MTLDPQALAEVFARYPGVQAVYLFGSHAAGTARPRSDVDLAVVPRDASVREQRLDILTDLVRAGVEHVDLVFLDTDDLVMLYEAVRYNRVVYQAADFERGTFYSYVIRRYFDFLPYLERQRAAYKRRLLDDQT